jgi:hypothetical protein
MEMIELVSELMSAKADESLNTGINDLLFAFLLS